MSELTHSTNASPVEFGWDFQHNAGICIMLMNMKNAKAIRVEGRTEDIEVVLNDNRKVFAQAKSIVEADDYSHVLANLKKAFETLDTAWKTGEGETLIYTTNCPNPLSGIKVMSLFAGAPKCWKYDDLPRAYQEKIDKVYEERRCAFPKERLRIFILGFHGNDESNRYSNVKMHINEFLDSLKLSDRGWGQRALDRWQSQFGRNASKTDQDIRITKAEMIWPLIVWLCELNEGDDRLEDYDQADVAEIMRRYGTIINDRAEDFRFATKVLGAYDAYCSAAPNRLSKEQTSSFVRERWSQFCNEFDLSETGEKIAEAVIKLAIENVIRRRYEINRIKNGVNL